MGVGVNQRVIHWLDETITEDETRNVTIDVDKVTELIFWIENDSTSQDEVGWLLETQMSGSDIWLALDQEDLGVNGFDPGDGFGIFFNPYRMGQSDKTHMTVDWDDDAGAGSEQSTAQVDMIDPMQTLKLTITADAAAGNYLVDSWLIFRS